MPEGLWKGLKHMNKADSNKEDFTRRKFLTGITRGLVASAVVVGNAGVVAGASGEDSVSTNDERLQQEVKLTPLYAASEQSSGRPPLPYSPEHRIGIAVVGLGHLSIGQILPAFGASKRVRLAGLVSGDWAKAKALGALYGVPAKGLYNYQNYESIRENPEIEAVYVVLPNALHAEYTIRAAAAGKHVLCEKPMATNPQECEQMIAACHKADRKLMIAYRIQYEPYNRAVQAYVRDQKFGRVKFIESVNTQNQGDANQWRQKRVLAGGGSLPDVGLYCLNTTRFLLGEEPTEVLATIYSTPDDPRFREVEETVAWQMQFPSGALANCVSSYGLHQSRRYRVYGESGWIGLDPAFSYDSLRSELSQAQGKIEMRSHLNLEPKNQFALEMDHFGECIQANKTPYTPGEEGLQDQRLMAAIYDSANAGKPVRLNISGAGQRDQFRGSLPHD
jgi:predicted dehydrogenase